MVCPVKTHKFYTDLLKGFKQLIPGITDKEADRRAIEVWMKTTDNANFEAWYGNGKRDSLKNAVINDKYEYVNDKGETKSILDFENELDYQTNEKFADSEESLNTEIAEYQKLIDQVKDILVKKIKIHKNTGKFEEVRDLQDLRDRLDNLHTKEALAQFAKNAINEIGRNYNKLQQLIQINNIDNPKLLAELKNYVSSYDIIENIRYELNKRGDQFTSIDNRALSIAIEQKNFIKKYYQDRMIPIIAKELAGVSHFFKGEEGLNEITQMLYNAPFDISGTNLWLDFLGDSKDPILALTAKLVDETYQKTRRQHIAFRHELDKVAKKFENSMGNPVKAEDLFRDLIETDINGKPTGYLLNEFKLGEFNKEREKYIDAMNAIEDKNSPEFEEARENLYKWLRENTIQRYTAEYYKIMDSLPKEVRAVKEKFSDAKKDILNKYKVEVDFKGITGKTKYTYDFSAITDEDYEKLQELESEEAQLRNFYYKDGTRKGGFDRTIAIELRKFAKARKDMYEKVAFNEEGFEAAKKAALDKGEEAYEKWRVRNTKMEFSEEFWNTFNKAIEVLKKNDGGTSKIQEEINSILAPHRDENGIVNGEHLTEAEVDRILELTGDKLLVRQGEMKSLTAAQLAAKQTLNNLVTYNITEYYDKVYDEKHDTLSEEEFNKWFYNNHYSDPFTGEWRPISIWTTMVPKNKKHILLEQPNDNWYVSDVTEKYHNPDYREDENGYGVPVKKWVNPQYERLMNSSNQAMIDYYHFFKEKLHDADQKIPAGLRLGYRLPSIRKRTMQRIIEGGLENTVKIAKESVKDRFIRRKDDTDLGQLMNEANEPVDYVPVFFIEKIEPAEMSLDLTSLLSSFYYMATNHENYSGIIDTLEGIKTVVKNREVTTTDSAGRQIKNPLSGLINKNISKKGEVSNSYAHLEDFIKRIVYGQTNNYLGFIDVAGTKFDKGKLFDALGTYTSYNLLAFNFIAGTLNIAQGESNNWAEAHGGEFYNKRDYGFANLEYDKNIPQLLGDIGARTPLTKIGLLNETLDTLNKYSDEVVNHQDNTRFKRLMSSNTLFFLNNLGEHSIQSKVMIAMLRNTKALDKNGKEIEGIPSMYDAFTVKDGKLHLDERVANFTDKEQAQFTRKMQFILRRLHGNYAKFTSAKWQADARLRLIGAMRKWIRPGFQRRWEGRRNNEFGEVVTEGMYISTGRFLKQVLIDLKQLKASMISEDWKKLSSTEKANIRRTVVEVSQIVFALVASSILLALAGGDDKDKRKNNTALLYLTYQANRLVKEYTFYINPISAQQILRSPAASMNTVEGVIKLFNQLLDPTERYKTGYRKGELKIQKKVEDITPFYKHFHRAFTADGLEDQLAWMQMR